jgi:hypothetical protein
MPEWHDVLEVISGDLGSSTAYFGLLDHCQEGTWAIVLVPPCRSTYQTCCEI